MTRSRILAGDALEKMRTLPDCSVQTCVTSPPYFGLRSYLPTGHPDKERELGLEKTPELYVERMVEVFREVRRVLRNDGTLWLNIGDSYVGSPRGNKPGDVSTSSLTNPRRQDVISRVGKNPKRGQSSADDVGAPHRTRLAGLKPKDLIGIPWMLAFALRTDGWYLRSPIIWAKPNGMPGSQKDRPTLNYEFVFLLSKRARYYYDWKAVATPLAESSRARLRQDVDAQEGSHRANAGGKTNGAMKAVKFGGTKYATRDERDGGSGRGCAESTNDNALRLGKFRNREREREREREFTRRAHLLRQRMEGTLTKLGRIYAPCGGSPRNRTKKRTTR